VIFKSRVDPRPLDLQVNRAIGWRGLTPHTDNKVVFPVLHKLNISVSLHQ
jgi:hypothetical protein